MIDYWEVARRVCTRKELDALELRQLGYGSRLIAVTLGVSRGTARDRLENADRKVTAAIADRHNQEPTTEAA